MSIREEFEEREKSFIADYGCLSINSKGRVRQEESCQIRTVFQQDRDRILYSNAFRRLKHKTQVFLSPLGDEYRTRLTHTLEVAQIARTIARAVHLNEDLAEAIALGHDLGHTPFGHSGEFFLNEICSKGFSHNEQSLRIVEILEKKGKGLNLTYEVRDGILKHSKGFGKIIEDDPNEAPLTAEGCVVRIADIAAYLNHDLDDAIRSKVITNKNVPEYCSEVLGHTHAERASAMVCDIISNSKVEDGKFSIKMSEEVHSAMIALRKFLYDNVYTAEKVHNAFVKAKNILSELYNYFLKNEADLEKELKAIELIECYDNNVSKEKIVCDLIATMTDRYALNLYKKLFLPAPFV